MSVFREIEIEWGGKSYSITPSNRLLRRIEGQGISLIDLMARMLAGQPPVSHMAYVVSVLLQEAGATVTEDEIYSEVMTASQEDQDALSKLARIIVLALTPEVPAGKN